MARLFTARVDRDGEAPALEALAQPEMTGVAGPGEGRGGAVGFGRPREIIERGLAQKILDSWLQNRHQILVPLTFRLGRLDAGDVVVLTQFTAVSMLNASAADAAATASTVRWLEQVGAGDDGIAAFRAAVDAPRPLSVLLREIGERGLQPYAYAAAVIASDTREPAGHLFANYVAARLSLPADAVRSIDRRFRR